MADTVTVTIRINGKLEGEPMTMDPESPEFVELIEKLTGFKLETLADNCRHRRRSGDN